MKTLSFDLKCMAQKPPERFIDEETEVQVGKTRYSGTCHSLTAEQSGGYYGWFTALH